jgi:hypothetical protein
MQARLQLGFLFGAVLLTGGPIASAEGGDGSGEPRPPHPEPRLIVNVLAVRGPHKPDRVQHDARYGWKRIVRCYKAQGAKEHAVVTMELGVSGEGSVTNARGLVFEPKDRELTQCLVKTLPGLAMPKAPADSTADIEIRLSPGDRPEKK